MVTVLIWFLNKNKIPLCDPYSSGFPGGSVVKNPPTMQKTQETDSVSRLGRLSGRRHGNPPLYSCLENLMDRGAWRATVPRVVKRRFTTEAT